MILFPTVKAFFKDEMGGAALFVPLALAGLSLFGAKKVSDRQERGIRRAQEAQNADMQRQQSAMDSQNALALREKEQLQREESDRIRSSFRKKGRRVLLTGDETGTNGAMRKTLG